MPSGVSLRGPLRCETLRIVEASYPSWWSQFGTTYFLRACLHDSGMTFRPERVHSIPIHFSVSVYMIPRRKSSHSGMSSFRFSFRNEIFVLEWHFILVSCKHRTNFVPRWNRISWNRIRWPQFDFREKKRNSIYCLAQRSSSMVKLLVKFADRAINEHKNMFARNMRHLVLISRETCATLFWSRAKTAHVKMPLVAVVDSVMWMLNELHSGTSFVPEWKSFRNHVNRLLLFDIYSHRATNILKLQASRH